MAGAETRRRFGPHHGNPLVRALARRSPVLIAVDDNGPGVPDELVDHIVEDAVDYLRQEIDFDEPHAFVEYWGRGYTQDCLTRLAALAAERMLAAAGDATSGGDMPKSAFSANNQAKVAATVDVDLPIEVHAAVRLDDQLTLHPSSNPRRGR
mgnify:CR=1 FL=1